MQMLLLSDNFGLTTLVEMERPMSIEMFGVVCTILLVLGVGYAAYR